MMCSSYTNLLFFLCLVTINILQQRTIYIVSGYSIITTISQSSSTRNAFARNSNNNKNRIRLQHNPNPHQLRLHQQQAQKASLLVPVVAGVGQQHSCVRSRAVVRYATTNTNESIGDDDIDVPISMTTTTATAMKEIIPIKDIEIPTSNNSNNDDNDDGVNDANDDEYSYWNEEQLMIYANEEGIDLTISKVGPLIRTVARTTASPPTLLDSNNSTSSSSSSILLGYVEGFVRPSQPFPFSKPMLHLDKMEVFQKQIQLARGRPTSDTTSTLEQSQPQQFRNGGTILGVGLLLGYLCILDYVNNSNKKNSSSLMTEFLAIDDESYQHLRLVKYYTTAGFAKIRYIGDDILRDVPDRIIWGGCGTLLRQNCIILLQKWTKLMERSRQKRYEREKKQLSVTEE